MNSYQPDIAGGNVLLKYIYFLIVWSVLVGGSLVWNIHRESNETLSMAISAARTNINKDILFRKWVASHGGVYVKPSASTPPNTYLKTPDRDVVTTSGIPLTLMNPAYALRELQDSVGKDIPIKNHITSLKPINPHNGADVWERSALQSFANGEKEALEVIKSNGESHLRYMLPFVVEHDCLKCHENQGYKLGDIRGGISTDVSMSAYQAEENKRISRRKLTHSLVWLVGALSLAGFYRKELRFEGERRHAEKTLKESEKRLTTILDKNKIQMWAFDGTHYTYTNKQWFDYTGQNPNDLLTIERWISVVHPDDREESTATWIANWETKTEHDNHFRLRRFDGVYRDFICHAVPVFDEEGVFQYFQGFNLDITERKEMEQQIRRLAYYDALTNLPNRRMFNDRLNQAFALSKRTARYGAIMFIDLDNFKPLNDSHGHDVGDLLLIEVAQRLANSMREIDTVARFGGDEFVVMLSELEKNEQEAFTHAMTVAEKILAILGEPYEMTIPDGIGEKQISHRCSASIGVAMFIDHEASSEELLKWADSAMYQAKEGGRNQIRFYEKPI